MTAPDTAPGAPRATAGTRRGTGPALVVGAILIIVGLAAAVARVVDVDLGRYIGAQTWPFLVILPGLVLIATAFVRTPPDGLGLAIAGSIVAAVGTLLLVQANTGAWASWAYAWALIPGAAGCGLAGYGLRTRTPGLVDQGARMILIAGFLYVAGWWYFEALFATGDQPMDLGTWWPIGLVVAGALVAVRALREGRRATPRSRPMEPGRGSGS